MENLTRWTTTRSVLHCKLKISLASTVISVGIRNFIVGITVKVASDEVAFRKEKTYVNKLNLALVQVRLLPRLLYQFLFIQC